MENSLKSLKTLIDYIQRIYTDVTDEWLKCRGEQINLKRTLVSEVIPDGTVYRTVIEYVRFMNGKNAEILLGLPMECTCRVTARVKAHNSIEYKICSYKTDGHEFGKIPLNKCVNDLFGLRIILEPPTGFKEIMEFIENKYPGKYRCIDSSKHGYKAVHLYFKKDNLSFPWELQIWNCCDVENNFAMHKSYKQEYTTWEKESKEGGIIGG